MCVYINYIKLKVLFVHEDRIYKAIGVTCELRYCPDIGFELSSASFIEVVCLDSSVFLVL